MNIPLSAHHYFYNEKIPLKKNLNTNMGISPNTLHVFQLKIEANLLKKL